MSQEQSSLSVFNELREFIDQSSSRKNIKAASGEEFIFNFLLRCRRKNGRQFSYAKVWLTESDGITPFKPDSLYLSISARGGYTTRNTNVSMLEAALNEEIESGQVGYVVTAQANSYGPDAESGDSLNDCATP
ncbi:MAG: hypothetical protein ABR577_16305 [Pyrinomonadaceae bacterium]